MEADYNSVCNRERDAKNIGDVHRDIKAYLRVEYIRGNNEGVPGAGQQRHERCYIKPPAQQVDRDYGKGEQRDGLVAPREIPP